MKRVRKTFLELICPLFCSGFISMVLLYSNLTLHRVCLYLTRDIFLSLLYIVVSGDGSPGK